MAENGNQGIGTMLDGARGERRRLAGASHAPPNLADLLERVLDNIFHQRDDVSWGPNNQFRFPKHGGTGAVWTTLFERLHQVHPARLRLRQFARDRVGRGRREGSVGRRLRLGLWLRRTLTSEAGQEIA